MRTVDDQVRIAAAGGGITIDARVMHTDDLVKIAEAGSNKGATIIMTGLLSRSTDDLVRIGAAGQGCVLFEGA